MWKARFGAITKNALRRTEVIAAFALVDMYGSGFDTVTKLKSNLTRRVPRECRSRFHPHVAVQELEAWVFADDEILFNWLGHTVGPFPSPETINMQSPPAK